MKRSGDEKIEQVSLGISIKPSNPNQFPTAYGDDVWDIPITGSKLAKLLGNVGSYSQHEINEILSSGILHPPISFEFDFENGCLYIDDDED